MRCLVVGSGAGGAAAAQVLAERYDVTILERGPTFKTCGTTDLPAKYYEIMAGGDVEVWQTLCDGGSTMVSLGNAVRTLEREIGAMGIDLAGEYDYLEKKMGVTEAPPESMGPTTQRLMEAADDAGFEPRPMPKAIDFARCTGCGRCAFGCVTGARWDSRRFLKGVRMVNGVTVERVVQEGGVVKGVQAVVDGKPKSIRADKVILSAGAIHTPRILSASSIEAGNTLFVDPFVTVGGVIKGARQDREMPMAFYSDLGDLVISPHYSVFLREDLKGAKTQDMAGLMVKIKDDNIGRILEDGIVKTLTKGDTARLEKGIVAAKEVLHMAGVKKTAVTHVRGVHQGGTFPIMSSDLGTDIQGLYVADASLLPEAPGKPPMLAVMALARRVAKAALED